MLADSCTAWFRGQELGLPEFTLDGLYSVKSTQWVFEELEAAAGTMEYSSGPRRPSATARPIITRILVLKSLQAEEER